MARVLVTGANGHVGCNLVRDLSARGHSVVAFVRRSADVQGLQGVPVEIANGDVRDRASVESAARGCEAIFNVAAVYDSRGSAEEILRTAMEGVGNVLHAAAKLGVPRVVHTSSIVAIGYSRTPVTRDATRWNEEARMPYYRAKTESERRAWALAEELRVPLTVVCPAVIIGRHDYRITPSMRYVRQLVDGENVTSGGGTCYVDVRDVSLAHVLAWEKGRPGARYIAGGENLTWMRAGELLGNVTGRRPGHIPMPRPFGLAVVALRALGERLLGREPLTTYLEAAETLNLYGWFDLSSTERDLGHRPRPARETFEDTVRWLVHRKVLRPRVLARLGERFPPDSTWARAA